MTGEELEHQRKLRVVQGWRYREDFGPKERNEVRRWLRGEGPVPAAYVNINEAIGFGTLL